MENPVVFLHGNGDTAISFDMPPRTVSGYTTPARSQYDELKAAGYNDCELFGVTYLSADERANPQVNYHEPYTYTMIKTFIDKVKAYTGKSQVDIVAHSLGSSMALAMIHNKAYQGSVRRFVNIGGGIRGLQTCLYTGYQNALAPTCNAEAYVYPYNYYTFGLYPSSGLPYYGYNRWTGSGSGHEPMHGGFVGMGMLDAACPGAVFTSPTPDQMYEAAKAVNSGAGVLFLVKNYTGDVLNFEMAADMAYAEGIPVQNILIEIPPLTAADLAVRGQGDA